MFRSRALVFTILVVGCSRPRSTVAAPDAGAPALQDASIEAEAEAQAPSPAPVSSMRVLTTTDLAKDIRIRGKLAKALAWSDKNGENLVTFALLWRDTMEDHDSLRNVYLTVEHLLEGKKLLETYQDKKESCDDYAMSARFEDEAFAVTDLDGDGIGEVTFAYTLKCTGNAIAWQRSLVMLENGDSYVLRSRITSSYELDKAFREGPPAFRTNADVVWRGLKR